jgi:hypothetical protein
MLIIIIGLAITSAILELMIASQVPLWRQWSHKSKLFNLVNSMFLSYLVGIAFGAQGLIAMSAGLLSTFMTIPGYAFLNWNYDTEKAKNAGGNRYKHTREKVKHDIQPKVQQTVAATKEVSSDIVKVSGYAFKTIAFPFKASYKTYKYFKSS